MKNRDRKLLQLFNALAHQEQEMLMAFAEFLNSRSTDNITAQPLQPPLEIPRPNKETVVEAIKRLSATYPMLDKSKMLTETSELVSQHMLKGRDIVEVIDEMEQIFRRHYEKYAAEYENRQ